MGYEQMQNNRAYVAGTVTSEPVFSHEVLGERFYDLTLDVKRLSDRSDTLPVTPDSCAATTSSARAGANSSSASLQESLTTAREECPTA